MRKPIVNLPSYDRVRKYVEYWDFVQWMATPTPLRKPATQQEFAKVHSMHYNQLGRWRAMPEFKTDVIAKVADLIGDDLSDVMYSLRNKIFKDGNAAEVRLFLEWVTKWMPEVKVRFEGRLEQTSSPELTAIIKEFEGKLKDILKKSE